MVFLKLIFYILLFVLIKIGDSVYSVLELAVLLILMPFKLLVFVFKKAQKKLFLKKKKNKKQKVSQVRDTMSLSKTYVFKTFKETTVFVFKLLIKSISTVQIISARVLYLIIKFISFILLLFVFPARLLKRKLKSKHIAKELKEQNIVVKNQPSFLFKLKYIAFGSTIALVFFFLPATFFLFISDLPKLSNLTFNHIPKTTKILDRNGNLLFEIYSDENRTIVPLKKIPKNLIDATIAIEDKDFYKHSGFDLRAIARAIYVNTKNGKTQGGSTITQQLVKSALLTPEPTVIRKVRELVLAFWAERKYTKNQILEFYFNFVPYGGTAWGVEAASNVYFGKDVSNLTLAESAYIAGLPQAPSEYGPYVGDGKNGKNRQREVLNAMVSEKYITKQQAEKAFQEKLSFVSSRIPIKAPHFVMYVKELLVRKYGLFEVERGGLQVTTTLDIKSQEMVQNIVTDEVFKDQNLGIGNGAALITSPKNGDILAMVGSKDYFDIDNDGNVNLTTSLRQPGSAIKLITYALALSKGYTEATILDDLPLTVYYPGSPSYTPVNYDGAFHGRVPLRIAFANSFNIPAVRVAQKLGVSEIVYFAKKMGITTWKDASNYGLSITLGAAEVSMTDLSTAYGVIANGGQRVDLNPILEVKDSEGKILEKKEVLPVSVIDQGIAFIISDILSDSKARSIEFGTNTPLIIPNQYVSVKTGTTDNKRDNWTIGFTPDYLVATWVGNNNNAPMSQALASGITGAAPMWNQIMTKMLEGKASYQPVVPDGVVKKPCFGYSAYFIKGTEEKVLCRIITPTPPPKQ